MCVSHILTYFIMIHFDRFSFNVCDSPKSVLILAPYPLGGIFPHDRRAIPFESPLFIKNTGVRFFHATRGFWYEG